jgi:phospholipase C
MKKVEETGMKRYFGSSAALSGIHLLVCLFLLSHFASAQISSFEHIVIVVQENRTPDNLFHALRDSLPCSTAPNSTEYDIQTSNWLDNEAPGGIIQPISIPLGGGYNPTHSSAGFLLQCNLNPSTRVCQMGGNSTPKCTKCPSQPTFRYVDNSTGEIDPYIQLVSQYGWANYMFQTNQGPSMPAHQFLFGATAAPSTADDPLGIFVTGNEGGDISGTNGGGCASKVGAKVKVTGPTREQDTSVFPCFEHNTLPDILPSGFTWKYYTVASQNWNAPVSINHICQPTQQNGGGACEGSEYLENVATDPKDFLIDIGKCTFANLIWVIPRFDSSDHGGAVETGGPSWVASIINAVGESTCRNPDGTSYWDTTAILVTWDDWGGWYDHEPPTILPEPEGNLQYGFRVPLLFVSAYTPPGYIDNGRHDFGSVARFVEYNFGVAPGILGFADARASDELSGFYNLMNAPNPFVMIPAKFIAQHFINDTRPVQDPDDY